METKVKGYWLGHSAIRLESPEGKVIYIDPFLSQNPKTPDEWKRPDKVDYILLTHGHGDHVGDTLDIAARTGCKVVGQVELIGHLVRHGLSEDQAVEFNKGGTVRFDDFSVTLVSANHSSSFINGEYAGEAGGMIVTFDDDIVFYHMGDTNIFGDLEIYGDLYEPDVIAIPIGDHYTMGPREAAICCEMINPALAIPIHYGTFPLLSGDPNQFKELAEDYSEAKVVLPRPGEEFLGD